MTQEQWEKIQRIYLEAADLDSQSRHRFLEQECAGDEEIRRGVERMLAVTSQTDGFFGRALAAAATSVAAAHAPKSGDRFGPWELVRTIGQGGMGAVYLASRADGAYRKEVALKIIRVGFDTEPARERFLIERQILANLEHPHIARLLEGGQSDRGLPYVVMEFVDGKPIDQYCRDHSLSVEARIGLFLQVCSAVAYAHRNLIVHRDIKPANILVTPEGQPKLMDFGIAKLLEPGPQDPAQALTRAGERAMTPEYASPEQVLGAAVTTATDVYSLGVVLFELLAQQRAFEFGNATASQIERTVCEQEPPRPSIAAKSVSDRLARRLAGDLDNIILKALRKEPSRRYQSVEELAADLRRHLDGYPVLAHADSWGYRAGKFLRRRKLGIAVAALFFASIAGFLTMVVKERDTANRERAKAEQVVRFLTDSFEIAAPARARGRTITARDILDQGASRVETDLQTEPAVQANVMRTIARVYSAISEHARARQLIEKAMAARGRATPSAPAETITDMLAHADALRSQGEFVKSEEELRRALTMLERDIPRDARLRAALLQDLGATLRERDQLNDAEKYYREALAIRRKVLGEDHEDVIRTMGDLGWLLQNKGEYNASAAMIRQALERAEKRWGEVHPTVANQHGRLTFVLQKMQRHQEALPHAEKAVAIDRKLYGNTHHMLASDLSMLGSCYMNLSRFKEALHFIGEAYETRRRVYGDKHPHVAGDLGNLALAYHNSGIHGEMERQRLAQGLALMKELRGPDSVNYAIVLSNTAENQRELGEVAAAEASYRESIGVMRKRLGPRHPNVAYLNRKLAETLMDRESFAEARKLLDESLDIEKTAYPDRPNETAYDRAMRARCLAGLGERSAALELAEKAVAELRSNGRDDILPALTILGRLYLDSGDTRRALPLLEQADRLEQSGGRHSSELTRTLARSAYARALLLSGRTAEAAPLLAATRTALARFSQVAKVRTELASAARR